jgi:hypothetical protein
MFITGNFNFSCIFNFTGAVDTGDKFINGANDTG